MDIENKNKEVESLSLSYDEAIFLFALLSELLLHGQESRSRNKIANLLKGTINECEKERIILVEKFAEKDDKGKPKLDAEGQHYLMSDNKGFEKEFKELTTNSKFIIDVLPSNKQDVKIVKNIILNTQKDFNYEQGEIYSAICGKLESI